MKGVVTMDKNSLVGIYAVAKAMSVLNGSFGMYTREEVEAGTPKDELEDALQAFAVQVEFTEDGGVREWVPLPPGVPEEAVKEALLAEQIKGYRDGLICMTEKEWKEENGECFINTGEHREVFGEIQSPWDKLDPDEDGLLPFGSGMMLLKKIG